MSSKQQRYFSGFPPDRDPSKPLPGEVPPQQKQLFTLAAVAIGLVGAGVLLGIWMAPESPTEAKAQIAALETQLRASQDRVRELERGLGYQQSPAGQGKLRAGDRSRHEREGRKYVQALRRVKAQAAAELMEWFIARWNQLLDSPQSDDRVARRAATLSLLVGGMAANLNPGDYVPWQAEFLNSRWLGELHFDIDGDGLPGKRSTPNTHDGFANVSICHIAMALNQSVTDAQVLVMPDMKCDRPESRMSVFLQGRTFDDALDEFVRVVKEHGFLAVERQERGVRLILIGSGHRPGAEE